VVELLLGCEVVSEEVALIVIFSQADVACEYQNLQIAEVTADTKCTEVSNLVNRKVKLCEEMHFVTTKS
jgi:hypothetical protein